MKTERNDFHLDLFVQHWSGCTGGYFDEQKIKNIAAFLEEKEVTDPWLKTCLNGADAGSINAVLIEHSKNGKNDYPVGQFWAKTTFIWDGWEEDNEKVWAVMVWKDGAVTYPIRQHKREEDPLGNGNYCAYRLNTGRPNPDIVFAYTGNSQDFFKHLYFQNKDGMVAANLYCLPKETLGDDASKVDLQSQRPYRSAIVAYKVPRLISL